MKFIKLVFSPTGGTEKVADTISGVWNAEIQKEDLSNASKDFGSIMIDKKDFVLIAVPSFGGRVPAIAVKRLSQINGNEAKCAVVCVYGNRAYEDTLIELKNTAENCGFSVIAAIAAVAEHSIMHQYATGRPDQNDIKKLKEFSNIIYEKFSNGDSSSTAITVPGNSRYKKSGAGGLIPKAGSKCTKCGICAENCPVQAIDKNKIKSADPKKCISCMRCVAICPQHARKVNNTLVAAASLAIKKACSVKKECELYI